MSHPPNIRPPLPDPMRPRQRRPAAAVAGIRRRHSILRLGLAAVCLLAAALQSTACSVTQSPAEAQPAGIQPASTPEADAASQRTAASPAQSAPLVTPVATAALIRPAAWSPDSRWLAYRASSQEQLDAAAGEAPEATWAFYDAVRGDACSRPDIEPVWNLTWEAPSVLLLSTSVDVRRSAPCGPLEPASPAPPSEAIAPAAASANGAFAARTDLLSAQAGVLHLQTTLTDLAEQRDVVQVEWSIDERLGDLGLGGEWIGPATFLIYESLEQGPLLLETSGTVVAVLPDRLGIDVIPSILGPEAYGWIARPSINTAAGTYHLLLSGVGQEANFPMAVLYHSEDGSHETLPYRHSWRDGFTPDGLWLLMDARPNEAGYETHQVWLRPLDTRTGEWVMLAERLDSDLWPPDMKSYAWQQGSQVHWQTFPAGDPLGTWEVAPYSARPAMISPDGCRLAAEGNIPGDWPAALFVWGRCSG